MRKLALLEILFLICQYTLFSQESAVYYTSLSEKAILEGDFPRAEAILKEGCNVFRSTGRKGTVDYFRCGLTLVTVMTDYYGPVRTSGLFDDFKKEYEASGLSDVSIDALVPYTHARILSYMGKEKEVALNLNLSLKILEDNGMTDGMDYANVLSAQASATPDREAGRVYCESANQILRSIGSPVAMVTVGMNLMNRGIIERKEWELSSAFEKETEAERLWGQYLVPEHPFYVNLYLALAGLCQRMGEVDTMFKYIEKLDRIRSLDTIGDLQKAVMSLNDFNMMMYHGKISESEEAFQGLRDALVKAFGKESAMYGRLMCDTGTMYGINGDISKAEEHYREGIAILEKTAGKTSMEYITKLSDMSEAYLETDFQKAFSMLSEAIVLYEENFKKRPSFEYADMLAKMAYFLALKDQNTKAIETASKAESALVASTSEGYFNYHTVMSQLSLVFEYLGDKEKAREHAQKAYHSLIASGNQNTAPAGTTLYRLGMYTQDSDEAGRIKDQALSIIEATGALSVSIVGQLIDRITDIFSSSATVSDPVALVEKYNKLIRVNLRRNLSSLDEKGREQYWKILSPLMNKAPELVYVCYLMDSSKDYSGAIYDLALLRKGQVLSSTTELERLIGLSDNPSLEETLKELKAINEIIRSDIPEVRRSELQKRAETLEKALIEASSDYGDFLRDLDVTWQDVRGALGPNDVAVEFIDCGNYNDAKIFVPVLLRKDRPHPVICNPFVIPEADINLFATGGNDYYNIVYDKKEVGLGLLWDGVKPYLKPNDTIWFSAEGVLNSLAIEHLAIEEGKLICDLYATRRLSSTRELIRHKAVVPSTYVLFGGLDYNASEEELRWYAGERGGKKSEGWGYLSNTREEVTEIKDILSKSKLVRDVKVISGAEGVEESFKKLSGNAPAVIHVATHGFYMASDSETDAMKRSGLVFAGANTPSSNDIDDGLLTSEEISLMDLRGCDLVVLSACATGVGAYNTDGVYGLQRAFKKAGAKSVLMTMWDVADDYTALIMQLIYLELGMGRTPREAYENGIRKFREICDEIDLQEDWLWAGFVMLD